MNTRLFLPILLGLLAYALFSANSHGLMLYALDEAKNSQCAYEMHEANEWVVPTFNQELRTDKPPLHYYFMSMAYSLFGKNPFAARFFGTLMGVFTVLLTFGFTRKLLGQGPALWASLVLLASIHLAFQFHMAVPDPFLIASLSMAFWGFIAARQLNQPKYLWWLYIGVALGALSKGPVAIGLPGLVFLIHLLATKQFRWKAIMFYRPFLGALLVLAIALPWYIAVHVKTQGLWTQGFFVDHNLNRYSSTMEGHGGIFIMPLLFVLVGLLPFSVFIVQAVGHAWRQRQATPLLAYCLLVGLVIIGFFSISSTKLPNYTVPAYPFLAVVLGSYLHRLTLEKASKSTFISMAVLFIVALGIVIGGYFGLQGDPFLKEHAALTLYFIPLPIGVLAALLLLRRNPKWAYWVTTATFALGTLITYFGIYPKLDATNPVAVTLPKLDPNRPMAHYKRMNAAFLFYWGKPIPALNTPKEVKAYLKANPGAYILTRTNYAPQLEKATSLEVQLQHHDLFETWTTAIMAVPPTENPMK